MAAARCALLLVVVALGGCSGDSGGTTAPNEPPVGDPSWLARAEQSYHEAGARITEQKDTAQYFPDVFREIDRLKAFWAEENATEFVDRPRITLEQWLVLVNLGEPWRNEVSWRGGVHQRVYFLNRWGAKLAGDLWGPPDLFERPARHPAVVITDGSIQASARMYWWAAQTLAENGYVVLTYDVQGQGESETYAHRPDGSVWCGGAGQPPGTPPFLKELTDCPGFPFQQPANFGGGHIDAHNWLLSTPDAPHTFFQDGTGTARFNPWHAYVDPAAIGAAGHSLGAAAVSFVQGHPELLREPIRATVAWDALSTCDDFGSAYEGTCDPAYATRPSAPALNLTNDFFLPRRLSELPDPSAALAGFELWRSAGFDTMSFALASGTHLEYTLGPILPATRYGAEVAAFYTLAFFDRYLRGDPSASERLLARELSILHRDPRGAPETAPTTLAVQELASYLSYSAVAIDGACFRDWRYRRDRC